MNRFIKVLKNNKRELQSNKQLLWNKNHYYFNNIFVSKV